MRIANDYLTPKEAADALRCSVAALVRFRQERRGPAFVRVGRLVRYKHADLTAWLEASRVVPGHANKRHEACRAARGL